MAAGPDSDLDAGESVDTQTAFQLPEDLESLSEEELNQLHEDAVAAFQEAYEQPRTAENLETLKQITAAADQVKGALATIEAMDSEAAALAESMGIGSDDEDDDEMAADDDEEEVAESDDDTSAESDDDTVAEDAPSDEAPSDEAPADPDPPTDTESSDSDDEGGDVVDLVPPDPDDEDDVPMVNEQEPINVAASSTAQPASASPSTDAINAHRPSADPKPKTAVERYGAATIVASANLPDYNTGQDMTMGDVAEAFASVVQGFPKGGQRGFHRAGIARIHRHFPDDLKVPNGADVMPFANRAADEAQLEGGLVAAGGWCAPSETWYDLVSLETSSGLLSLPGVQVNRGGIRHTLGPDFRSIYQSDAFFRYTEAEDIAGDYDGEGGGTKPIAYVPCPEFDEDRLDLDGVQIGSGILQDTAYSEATERFVNGVMVAHAHKMNARRILDMVNGSDAVSPGSFGGPTTRLLNAVELVGTDMRYAQRLDENMALEVVLPLWVRPILRADLSNRVGTELFNISNADVDSWLRLRNVNPQYVYDWQDDLADAGSGLGFTTAATAWPSTVDFLIYPGGTWVEGSSDVITLDAVYDSTQFQQNNFIALFTEEGTMVIKRTHDARVVTVALGDSTEYGEAHAGTPGT